MGLAPHVRVGVLANVQAESGFDPRCITGRHYGLFQIAYIGQTRKLWSREYLLTVNGNLYAISSRKSWREWAKDPGRTAKEAALRFARQVERCQPQHYAARGVIADRWWRNR